MQVFMVVAAIIGLVVDALTLLAFAQGWGLSIQGRLAVAFTPIRVWIFAIAGALVTAYVYSRATGHWPFDPTPDGKVPIQAVFIVGPWVILAGMATGLW